LYSVGIHPKRLSGRFGGALPASYRRFLAEYSDFHFGRRTCVAPVSRTPRLSVLSERRKLTEKATKAEMPRAKETTSWT